MQPGAAIQQTELVLDACDSCVLLVCQGPVGCVLNVALHNTKFSIRLHCICEPAEAAQLLIDSICS